MLGFFIFYFISGICAALFQLFYDPSSEIPMIGASGAVSGILGAYLVCYPSCPHKNTPYNRNIHKDSRYPGGSSPHRLVLHAVPLRQRGRHSMVCACRRFHFRPFVRRRFSCETTDRRAAGPDPCLCRASLPSILISMTLPPIISGRALSASSMLHRY